jgi:hypothetical protein
MPQGVTFDVKHGNNVPSPQAVTVRDLPDGDGFLKGTPVKCGYCGASLEVEIRRRKGTRQRVRGVVMLVAAIASWLIFFDLGPFDLSQWLHEFARNNRRLLRAWSIASVLLGIYGLIDLFRKPTPSAQLAHPDNLHSIETR